MQVPSSSSSQPALSVLVLLPATAHMAAQEASPLAPISRPSPLISRKSGSTVPSLKSLNNLQTPYTSRLRNDDMSPDGERHTVDPLIHAQVQAGRRSSLAPGLGAGTEIRALSSDLRYVERLGAIKSSPPGTPDRSQSPSPGELSTPAHNDTLEQYRLSNVTEQPASGSTSTSASVPRTASRSHAVPAFGARKSTTASSGAPLSRRRPQTSATSKGFGQPVQRGSMALPPGSGLGGLQRNRPGWEADEVVSNLRTSGLEVTLVRNTSHLPPLLSSPSGSASFPPSISARPSQVTTVTPVILVPLCDSPSIPSLSLLLAQGTTPTAVCFQQDVLERARQTEEEWLPAALEQIREVISMKDYKTSPTYESPIILAYSANPALNPTTTQRCIAAGASGVLKPPFHGDTARFLKRMVRAAREGRISSVVELPPLQQQESHLAPATTQSSLLSHDNDADNTTKVVLPPTALDMGGEHEGEKVLSAAMTHRRQSSINSGNNSAKTRQGTALSLNSLLPIDPSKLRRQDLSIHTPTTARVTTPTSASDQQDHLPIQPYIASLGRYKPSYTPRRRSVDVGCLSLALAKATRAFEGPLAITDNKQGQGFAFAPQGPRPPLSGGGMTRVKTHNEAQPGLTAEHEEESTETHLAELLSEMYCQSTAVMDVQMAEYEELSAPMTSEHRQRLVDAIATWDFRPHELDDGDLYRVATLLFEAVLSSEGVADLGIDRAQMNCLLFAIRAIYHAPNPYHNYVHAIDVLQATYSFLMAIGVVPPHSYLLDPEPRQPWRRPDEEQKPVCGVGTRRAREVLRPQDVFAVLVAAMGHDVGHPGLSNAFMKNAKTPLSEVYDDKSVLENMHCMLIVRLLRKHGLNYLICPNAQKPATATETTFEALAFRKVLYSSVLATDMSLHFAWIARLKEFGATLQSESQSSEEEDRIMLCQAIIKCADISNPTRPIDVSEHWSSVLSEEWAKQASLEQDLELPVSVIASADAALQAKGQIGFIDLFTQPLFEAVSEILPELQEYANCCAGNRSLWQTRLDDLMAQPDTQRLMVQHAIADASLDDRFRSLLPLLLPESLLETYQPHDGPDDHSDKGDTSASGEYPFIPSSSHSHSPAHPHSSNASESPSTKAMRAVYHTNLLEQRHRLSTWVAGSKVGVPIPGVGGIDLDFDRRLSTPGML